MQAGLVKIAKKNELSVEWCTPLHRCDVLLWECRTGMIYFLLFIFRLYDLIWSLVCKQAITFYCSFSDFMIWYEARHNF